MKNTRNKLIQKYAGMVLAAISLLISCRLEIEGVTSQAIRTFGVLAATLFIQVFESFPLSVSCLLSSALLFAFGCVDSISAAFSGYTNHVLYFTLASFAISAAFQKSALSRKLISLVVREGRMTAKRIMLAFMACAALMSSVMSNVAAVVIFIPFAEAFLSFYREERARKVTARSMMIGLVVAAMAGGMITPAGSSMNLIGIDLLKTYTGETVRFVDWMLMGLPLAAAVVLVAFAIITAVYPPCEPSEGEMKAYLLELRQEVRLTGRDWYIGVLIFATLLLWVLSSWIPAIDITVISLIAMTLMFLPKFPVLTWDEFIKTNSWGAFFVAGNHISIASAVVSTGLCDYFATLLFQGSETMSLLPLIAKIAGITFIFMAILPSAPAVVTILAPIIMSFAASGGLNPVMLTMACLLCVPNIYLFPLDAPLIVAYDKDAFTMFELPRATIWIQLAIIALVTLWIPVVFRIV